VDEECVVLASIFDFLDMFGPRRVVPKPGVGVNPKLRINHGALDFVIKKVFRASVVERDEQKSSAKIFRCVNERTFFWQKHTRLLRPNDFLEP
jgi:hypothetical protein